MRRRLVNNARVNTARVNNARVNTARVIAPAMALGLVLVGCGSDSGARRTVIVTETFTSGNAASAAGTAGSGPGVTVGPPADSSDTSGSSPAGSSGTPESSGAPASSEAPASSDAPASSTPKTTPKPKPTPKTTPKTTAPSTAVVDVTPLNSDCAKVLTVADIKTITGSAMPNETSRIKDVANPDVNSKGSIRCLYGITTGVQKVSMRITQYENAAAAQKQIGVTVASEKELGAKVSTATVSGQEANVLIRDGGLINVPYGDWTLAIATADGVLKGDDADRLQKLAQKALSQIVRTTR